MENIKIVCQRITQPLYAISIKDGRKTFDMQAFDGVLTADVQYDFNRRPLRLSAEIKDGDSVEIVLLDHRIELYVNGTIADEEWPAGNRLLGISDDFITNTHLEASAYTEKTEEVPSVISMFENAEGWYPGNGVFVGDCMPYIRDGEYHVLYLKDRHHHGSKWNLGAHQWEHISTNDFKTWKTHPMAVPITSSLEGSVCTGSWIREGEREYLFYTIRHGGGIPAPIRRSISSDGYHFEKDEGFSFIIPERYTASTARDPKIIKGDDGLFHMILTTRLAKEELGCLAHFVSRDLDTWCDTGTPIYISADRTEPECPDYIVYNGRYYLIYSLKGRAHYLISDSPFDGWREPKNPIIPCESVPKGAIWGERIVFTGFKSMGGYAGSMTFRSAVAGDDGELIFEPEK